MPSPTKLVTPPQKAALLECFQAGTRLVPPELRRDFILVGGAASIAHSSCLWTDDVDVAGSPKALFQFQEAVRKGAREFKKGPCETIDFVSPQGTRVPVECLILNGDFVKAIAVVEPLHEGFVASPAELLLLRAETVVGRGTDGDVADFRWLLKKTVGRGIILRQLKAEKMEVLVEAARVALTPGETFVLSAILSEHNFHKYILFKSK